MTNWERCETFDSPNQTDRTSLSHDREGIWFSRIFFSFSLSCVENENVFHKFPSHFHDHFHTLPRVNVLISGKYSRWALVCVCVSRRVSEMTAIFHLNFPHSPAPHFQQAIDESDQHFLSRRKSSRLMFIGVSVDVRNVSEWLSMCSQINFLSTPIALQRNRRCRFSMVIVRLRSRKPVNLLFKFNLSLISISRARVWKKKSKNFLHAHDLAARKKLKNLSTIFMLEKVQREDIKNKGVDPSREKFVVNKTKKNANTDARNFRWLTKPQRTRKEEGKSFQFDVKRATQERPKRHFVLCLQTHSATSWRQARDWEKSARGVMDELTGKSLKLSSSWTRYLLLQQQHRERGETCWSIEKMWRFNGHAEAIHCRAAAVTITNFADTKNMLVSSADSVIGPWKEEDAGRQRERSGVWKIWKNVFWIASKWFSIVVVREQRLDLNEIFENFFFELAKKKQKSARICLLDYFICEFHWPTIRIISSLESVFPY